MRCQGGRGAFLSSLPPCICRDRLPEQGGPGEAGSSGVTYGAINTSALHPLPHQEPRWEVGLVSSQPTRQLLSPYLGTCSGEPCSAPQHPLLCAPTPPSSSGLIYYISAFGRPAPPQKQPAHRAGERQAGGRRAGLAMTHALSMKCSLFKGLAGEEAKFKARLPEKITCHVKIAAI